MTTAAIRSRLISYLADADDNKVKAIYTLLENDIDQKEQFILSDEQFKILDREHELHITGKSKSYSWEEAEQIIKGKRVFE